MWCFVLQCGTKYYTISDSSPTNCRQTKCVHCGTASPFSSSNNWHNHMRVNLLSLFFIYKKNVYVLWLALSASLCTYARASVFKCVLGSRCFLVSIVTSIMDHIVPYETPKSLNVDKIMIFMISKNRPEHFIGLKQKLLCDFLHRTYLYTVEVT